MKIHGEWFFTTLKILNEHSFASNYNKTSNYANKQTYTAKKMFPQRFLQILKGQTLPLSNSATAYISASQVSRGLNDGMGGGAIDIIASEVRKKMLNSLLIFLRYFSLAPKYNLGINTVIRE